LFKTCFVRGAAMAIFAAAGAAASAQTLVLDTFNSSGGVGAVSPGTSWVGNVTQTSGAITVGGTAKDENGWKWLGAPFNASGMTSLVLTAQRDAGNLASSVVISFEDFKLVTHTISIESSRFEVGVLTPVSVSLLPWNAGFDATRISGWSLGGGTTGLTAFRMTFDRLELVGTGPAKLHSADTDRNSRIALGELMRVIELYNTRHASVRTGCYAVQSSSEDGFAPDAARANTATVALGSYHSADSNRDGKISLVELTRVVELYLIRTGTIRTGEYRTQAGSEDGFAPGS
jgi:hypothetical protein